MIADPVKELEGLVQEELENSEPQMPRATWLSDVLPTVSGAPKMAEAKAPEGNELVGIKDEPVDDDAGPAVYRPLLPLEVTEQTKFAVVLRCFDTWTSTVLTGAVAGSVFGCLYVLLH